MRILLTNDDGIHAEGIHAMQVALAQQVDLQVITVAPAQEQSATGHAITLGKPLQLTQVSDTSYKVNGTPADCVLLGLKVLYKKKPDLIISGINHGQNLGEDVYYSGTVAAAREGAINGINALAVSVVGTQNCQFEPAAKFIADLAPQLVKGSMGKGMFFNINVPNCAEKALQGVSITKPGTRTYRNVMQAEKAADGTTQYRVAGTPVWKREIGTDHHAIGKREISVTPLEVAPATTNIRSTLKKIIKYTFITKL